jgi:hypothetical protein
MRLPELFGKRMYRFVGEAGSKAGQGMHEMHRVVGIFEEYDGFGENEMITTSSTAPQKTIEVVTWGQKRMSWLGTLQEFWRQFEEVAA